MYYSRPNDTPKDTYVPLLFRSSNNYQTNNFGAPRGGPQINKNGVTSLFSHCFSVLLNDSETPRLLKITLKRNTVYQNRRCHLLRQKCENLQIVAKLPSNGTPESSQKSDNLHQEPTLKRHTQTRNVSGIYKKETNIGAEKIMLFPLWYDSF